MGIVRKVLGPLSKYDKDLLYTYIAKVSAIEGDEKLTSHYFANTICGLNDYLEEQEIPPEDVELYAIYLNNEILFEKERCMSAEGKWLKRPEICRSLEDHYKKTVDERYKGHVEKGECSFEDRDREVY